MNSKILWRSMSLVASVALITGATFAFFSDEETSTGNVFAAGEIDLEIDNTSYLNGVHNEATSWGLKDLESELFFNFLDMKPGDEGEDTVSFHINDNDAWLCVDIDITENDDNGLTDPEETDGDNSGGPGQGELASALEFVFWDDDGDNVLEDDETVITQGTADAVLGGVTWPLADSNGSVFDPSSLSNGGALIGEQTYFIGKAWCFGDLTLNKVAAGEGVNPTVASGVSCDGSNVDNTTQTDSLSGDITFRAVQWRNNESFVCQPTPSPTPSPIIQ